MSIKEKIRIMALEFESQAQEFASIPNNSNELVQSLIFLRLKGATELWNLYYN